MRPVAILKKFSANACLVVPLTGWQKGGKYYVSLDEFGGRPSSAVISQLRFVDRRRLINKIGTLPEANFKAMRKAVKAML